MTPPRKRAAPRTWACVLCVTRNPSPRKSCKTCGTKRGTGRKQMGKRLGTIWAALIVAGRICARCKKHYPERGLDRPHIEAAHIVRRSRSHNTRWHPRGGLPLCSGPGTDRCHYWFDEQASDEQRAALVIQVWGRETYDELHRIKNQPWDKDLGRVLRILKEAA